MVACGDGGGVMQCPCRSLLLSVRVACSPALAWVMVAVLHAIDFGPSLRRVI